MISPCFHGEIRQGRISLYRKEAFAERVRQLEGRRIELVLRKRKDQRSIAQNAYYWGVVLPVFCEFAGYTPEEAHEALKAKFLAKPDADPRLPTVRSTATLSTGEFNEYLERVALLAAEYGLYIPAPGEYEPAGP